MSTCSPVTRSESLVTSPPPKGRVVSGDGLSTGSQSNQRKRGTATADARRGTTPPNTEYAHSRTLARSDQRAPNSNPHAVNPGERGRAAERRVAASPPRGCLPRAPRIAACVWVADAADHRSAAARMALAARTRGQNYGILAAAAALTQQSSVAVAAREARSRRLRVPPLKLSGEDRNTLRAHRLHNPCHAPPLRSRVPIRS